MGDFRENSRDCSKRGRSVQAAIDVGTNTMLMLIAEVETHQQQQFITRIIDDRLEYARLGEGVHDQRRFCESAMQRARDCFKKYKNLCDENYVEKINAVATSASRDATNAQDFYEEIRKTTGIVVKIIDGKTEAKLSFLGGLLPEQNPAECAVLDIGGGSTEFVVQTADLEKVYGQSIDMGSVRATEMYLKGDPYTKASLQELELALKNYWKHLKQDLQNELKIKKWVGIAGTPVTLAALALNLKTFDSQKLDGYHLTYKVICDLYQNLSTKTQDMRASHPLMGRGRGDIIVSGTAILLSAMEYFSKNSIIISTRGLRHGVLLGGL